MVTEEEKQQAQSIGLEPEVVFNTLSDRRILAVQTEDTHETIMEISGYDLQINFNRDKLQNIADIESMLDGLKDLFRRVVMQDLLESNVEKTKIKFWCQVDIDYDGEQEVVLQTSLGNELVLTYKDGKVYCYSFPFRGMKNIKKDGSFESSGSAADTYIGRLKFNNGECYYSELCACDNENEESPIYRVNNKKTTKEQVDSFLKKQEEKENVVWSKGNPIDKE